MDLTQLLQRAKMGDHGARRDVIQMAYEDLRRIARVQMRDQREGHWLSSTALVHEMAVRVLEKGQLGSENRAQFLAYAATAMRHILVDHARARAADKRQGGRQRLEFDEAVVAADQQSGVFLRLNDALDLLAEMDGRSAQVVEMRYFGGMTNQEVADALNISPATVKRDWEAAKTWLLCQISEGESA